MKEFLKWLQGSADNKPGGASSKKLSAGWTLIALISPPVWIWTVWAYKHDDWSLLIPVLSVLLASVVTYFGINSNEKIKDKAHLPQDEKSSSSAIDNK